MKSPTSPRPGGSGQSSAAFQAAALAKAPRPQPPKAAPLWQSGKEYAKRHGIAERDVGMHIANQVGGIAFDQAKHRREAKAKASRNTPGGGAPQPGAGGGQVAGAAGAAGGVKTGFNPDDQAINAGSVMDRLGREGGLLPQSLLGDGARAAGDFRKSQQMNDRAQLQRGIAQENAQQNMQEQGMRSELLQMGLSNQAKIYGDMAQRAVSQVGLASQLQQALIQHRASLMQALMKQ